MQNLLLSNFQFATCKICYFQPISFMFLKRCQSCFSMRKHLKDFLQKASEASYRRKNYLLNYRKLNSFWHSAAGSEWFVAGGRERVSGKSQNWFPFSGLAKPHWGPTNQPTNQHRRDSEVSKERNRKATIRYTYRLYTFATFMQPLIIFNDRNFLFKPGTFIPSCLHD